MKSKNQKSKSLKTLLDLQIETDLVHTSQTNTLPDPTRTLRYIGAVTRVTTERTLKDIQHLMDAGSTEIALFVSSPGGTTGVAMSFYDTVRHILQPNLVTIGSGDVDSSGVIIFLSGTRRLVTARTTMLLHPAGRVFGNQRYTTQEMEAMLAEDKLKDEQYADVIAKNSKGMLTRDGVLSMMHAHTVLSPSKMVELGIADAVLA